MVLSDACVCMFELVAPRQRVLRTTCVLIFVCLFTLSSQWFTHTDMLMVLIIVSFSIRSLHQVHRLMLSGVVCITRSHSRDMCSCTHPLTWYALMLAARDGRAGHAGVGGDLTGVPGRQGGCLAALGRNVSANVTFIFLELLFT